MKIQTKTFLIDIGNSSTQYSIFDLKKTFNIRHMETKNISSKHIKTIFSDATCLICSVVPEVDELFKKYCNAIFINHKTMSDLKINIKAKEELGADRIVTALAAYKEYGESIIIDSGTAITFCYVDASGTYQGGAILPGLKIASQSLNNYTAKVPLIYVDKIDTLTGKTTKESVQVGLYHGYQELINGLIKKYKNLYPQATVIGTGSGLEIYKDIINLNKYDPELIFKGLYLLNNQLNS